MRIVLLPAVISLLCLSTGCSQTFSGPVAPPLETPQAESPPPVEQPPAETPPAEQPPVEQPPADTPPADTPPADDPPPADPPAADPPAADPPADDPPADDPPAPLDCGPNAADVAGTCTCDALYTVCDSSDVSGGCCAYGIDTFEITMVSATIMPFADAADEDPWDWSGFVPGWLQDLIGSVVVYLDEDAEGWVDVLDFVLDFAPELLEGTTPPDPFIEVTIDGETLYETSTQDDTIEPVWNDTELFVVTSTDELNFWFIDEDVAFDDTIAGVFLTQDQLQWYAGLGEVTFDGSDGLYSFTLAIEPVQ